MRASWFASAFFFLSGCAMFSRERPVTVLLTDAETGKPLPAAEVSVSYVAHRPAFAYIGVVSKAGNDGIAVATASLGDDLGIMVKTSAPGYLSEDKHLSAKDLTAIEPVPLLFGSPQGRQPVLTVALYAGPLPKVELIVPNGYRGTIRSEIHVEEAASVPPGGRRFSVPVSATGEARLVGPALLKRIGMPEFSARYADGTLLPRPDDVVGLWGLQESGEKFTFLVGTKAEYEREKPMGGGRRGGSSAP